jgi:hypothetical protein
MNILKKFAVLALLASASSIWVTACSDSSDATSSDVSETTDQIKKFVGTYYSTADGGATLTFHADGTMEHMRANMFLGDDSRRRTTGRGVWRQSGESEIRVSFIRFSTMPYGDTHDPGGLIHKNTYTTFFDELVEGRYLRYSVGTGLGEYFQPGQNPVTDEPVAALGWESNSEGYRMEVE